MFGVNRETEWNRAERAGWTVFGQSVDYIQVCAPLTGRGYVRFMLLHVGWICDTCGERVTVAQFTAHVRKAHR